MYHNLCPFDVVVSGFRYSASPVPLVFTPRTIEGSHPAFPVLLGYDAPAELPVLEAGTRVIIPRFAPAVTWALEQGLIPFCIPLVNGRAPTEFVCDHLAEPPLNLAITPPWGPALQGEGPEGTIEIAGSEGNHPVIWRAVPGAFVIRVADGPNLPTLPQGAHATRLDHGTVQVPVIAYPEQYDALLVPLDGMIIAAVARSFPTHAILVLDVPVPGKRTRCFQVR